MDAASGDSGAAETTGSDVDAAGLETFVTIETPEQIAVEVELAGVGSRFVAYAIDLLWQSAVLILAIVGGVAVASAAGQPLTTKSPDRMFLTSWGIALITLTFFVVNFGYFTLFEMNWRGQTPGKRQLRLRVIREGGYPLTFGASFLRNLLRIVDQLPFGYVVGVVTAWLGGRWQRIGDLAARTWVVRELPEGHRRPGADADSDVQLAADYWSRYQQFHREAGEDLARRLAASIAARRREPAPIDPVVYLGAVAKESGDPATTR